MKSIENEYDHDNEQIYLHSQVINRLAGGYQLVAEPCEPIYPDKYTQQQRRAKGKNPYYTVKSGNLRTDYEFNPPFVARIICDIPQVDGVVPGWWFYSDPAFGVREIDGLEATACRKFYISLHDSWEPGHQMAYHRMMRRKLAGIHEVIILVGKMGVLWRLDGIEIGSIDGWTSPAPYRMLATLAATKRIEKTVRWNIYDINVKKL